MVCLYKAQVFLSDGRNAKPHRVCGLKAARLRPPQAQGKIAREPIIRSESPRP
jgi:hypothetical protein